jgi:hypothetical protein
MIVLPLIASILTHVPENDVAWNVAGHRKPPGTKRIGWQRTPIGKRGCCGTGFVVACPPAVSFAYSDAKGPEWFSPAKSGRPWNPSLHSGSILM